MPVLPVTTRQCLWMISRPRQTLRGAKSPSMAGSIVPLKENMTAATTAAVTAETDELGVSSHHPKQPTEDVPKQLLHQFNRSLDMDRHIVASAPRRGKRSGFGESGDSMDGSFFGDSFAMPSPCGRGSNENKDAFVKDGGELPVADILDEIAEASKTPEDQVMEASQ